MTRHPDTARRLGYTLVELMTALTIVGVLTALAAPSFGVALEQSRADIATANLRAIWAAERWYWLENRQYAGSFADLDGVLDPSIASARSPYSYAITFPTGDSQQFVAVATRTAGTRWSGSITIDEAGNVTSTIPGIDPGSN
jgi:prepilin-type N-terminal cleavage/methylation domain-containing protein